ncbi:MAG: sugar ABC transporter permease [Clostridiales bacterium]|nr:sugar ABC transporter permease [Clostridiales bacterium]
MKQTEITVEKQSKPSKWVAIISATLLLLAIIASIVLGALLPKTSVVAAPSGNFTSVAMVENDFYGATSKGEIAHITANEEYKSSINLIDYANDNNLANIGTKTDKVQVEPGSPNIWATTDGGYLFRLTETNGKIEIKDYVKLRNGIYGLMEKGDYVYVLERDVKYACLKKYNWKAEGGLQANLLSSGHVYTPTQSGSEITLTPAQNLSVLSFEIMEQGGIEYAYIVFGDGLYRIAVDSTQNNWKDLCEARYKTLESSSYDEEYQKVYEERVAELTAKGEEIKDAEVVEYAKRQAKLSLQKKASAQLVKDYASAGLKSYEYSTGVVTMEGGAFDKNLYNLFGSDGGVQYRGCAYVASENKYYIATSGVELVTVDAGQDFTAKNARPKFNLHVEQENSGIILPKLPEANGNTLFYSKVLNVAYIIYSKDDQMSRLDLNTKTLTFTSDFEYDIKSIAQSADGETIYYMYHNPYEAEAGAYILRQASLVGRENQLTLQALKTVTFIVIVATAIVLLFACLCLFKPGYSDKFMYVMRGIRKQWIIYTIILATMSLVALFCFYPAIGAISLSFFDYTSERPVRLWNGFAHYKYMFQTPDALKEFINMFLFLASDLTTALLPPLIFAFFLTIMRNKSYSSLMRTLLFIPGIIPGVANTLLWREGILGTYGVVNKLLDFLNGANPNPELGFLTNMENPAMIKWSLIMMGFPFVGSYLIFYGAMMNVPDSYYEAAELDGITVIKRFVFIDIPLILAQIKYVFIMTFISSVQNFGRTYMTEAGDAGVKTPVHSMYLYVTGNNYGRASAYATVLFIFLFFATMINMRVQTKDNQVA